MTADAGAIKATIDFDAAGLERAVHKAMARATDTISEQIDTSMKEVEGRMASGFKKIGAGVAGYIGVTSIADGVGAAIGYINRLGAETESSLNMFQAVSKATDEQMEQVSDTAKELGNDISLPGVSAGQAALAMTELAKAGFSVEESQRAAKGALQLGIAAQVDSGRAAEIAAKQIQAFNLNVEDSQHVADVLANSANITAADMEGLSEALNQTSAVAHAAGFSFDETAAAIAIMSDNAIVGSDAGTSLKAMLLALQAPSSQAQALMARYNIEIFDSAGNMKSLAGITAELSDGTKNLTDEQRQFALATIFGSDAVRAVNVLLNEGSGELETLTKRVGEAGAAERLAAANAQGLVGSLGALQSTAESLAIEIYQNVSPAIDAWLRDRLEELPDALDEATEYVTSLADALEPAAEVVGAFMEAASPAVLNAFKAALAAVLGVAQGFGYVMEPIAEIIEDNEDAFKALVGTLGTALFAYKAMTLAVSTGQAWKTQAITQYRAQVDRVRTSYAGATTAAGKFRTVGNGMMAAVGGGWSLALTTAAVALGAFAMQSAEAKAQVEGLAESIDETTGMFTEAGLEQVLETFDDAGDALGSSGWLDYAKDLKIDMTDLTAAIVEGGDALDDFKEKYGDALRDDGSYESFIRQLEDTHSKVDAAHEKFDALSEGVDGYSKRLKQNADAHRETFPVADRVTLSLKGEAEAADLARRAILGLNDAHLSSLDAKIDFEEAVDNLREHMNGLTAEVKDNGDALDIHKDVGRDTYRAMIQLVEASDGVKGGMSRARQQIFDTIRPMVDSRKEAERLTDEFFDLKDAADAANNADVNISVVASGIGKVIDQFASLKIPTFATGGEISGPGTGTSDSILAKVSNGEHVLTAEEVKAAGGHDNIERMRAALRAGTFGGVAPAGSGESSPMVEELNVTVGRKEDLPDALDETLFHLRRIRRGGRYATTP